MNVSRYEPRYRPLALLDRLLADDELAPCSAANQRELKSQWKTASSLSGVTVMQKSGAAFSAMSVCKEASCAGSACRTRPKVQPRRIDVRQG